MIRLIIGFVNAIADLIFGREQASETLPDPIDEEGKSPVNSPAIPVPSPQLIEPAYLSLARKYIGVTEIPGSEHNATVLGFFAKAGFPGIHDDETAWCAAFANSCLEESGVPGSKSLAARSFETWGKKVNSPKPGDIVVFWRGSPTGWQGHVGFFIKQNADYVWVLGGNQKNKVSIEAYSKRQLLGYRTPVAANNSRTVKAASVGLITAGLGGTTILESQQQVMGISAALKEIGLTVPGFQLISQILGIVCLLVIIWARFDDLRTKGR